ncbi:MAG TPA: cytochrome c-type biogenesis protein CcmH [Gemmatimonadaceae bacterium]
MRRELSRREALRWAAAGAALLVTRGLAAQSASTRDSTGTPNGPTDGASGSNLFSMNQGAARTVHRPPKPGVTKRISDDERNETEKKLRCQCGCTLDIYTCRTTDFACEVSPAMHRDVMALVEGGYDAQEIIDAFTQTYGEKVLMAPTKKGFNLVGWGMPFGALLVGGGILTTLLRRWHRRAMNVRPVAATPTPMAGVDATDEELRRIEAAVRGDEG